jgi:hypothetical protein
VCRSGQDGRGRDHGENDHTGLQISHTYLWIRSYQLYIRHRHRQNCIPKTAAIAAAANHSHLITTAETATPSPHIVIVATTPKLPPSPIAIDGTAVNATTMLPPLSLLLHSLLFSSCRHRSSRRHRSHHLTISTIITAVNVIVMSRRWMHSMF